MKLRMIIKFQSSTESCMTGSEKGVTRTKFRRLPILAMLFDEISK